MKTKCGKNFKNLIWLWNITSRNYCAKIRWKKTYLPPIGQNFSTYTRVYTVIQTVLQIDLISVFDTIEQLHRQPSDKTGPRIAFLNRLVLKALLQGLLTFFKLWILIKNRKKNFQSGLTAQKVENHCPRRILRLRLMTMRLNYRVCQGSKPS
jgi:hypothetical protein